MRFPTPTPRPPTYTFNFDKYVDIDTSVTTSLQKTVLAAALVHGQIAGAEADAQAYAPDSVTDTHSFTVIDGLANISHSESTSATNGAFWYLG
jgi:hypothetical protein